MSHLEVFDVLRLDLVGLVGDDRRLLAHQLDHLDQLQELLNLQAQLDKVLEIK